VSPTRSNGGIELRQMHPINNASNGLLWNKKIDSCVWRGVENYGLRSIHDWISLGFSYGDVSTMWLKKIRDSALGDHPSSIFYYLMDFPFNTHMGTFNYYPKKKKDSYEVSEESWNAIILSYF